MAALEEGLNLERTKDESSKESHLGWASWGSLRRGMTIIISLCLGMVLLMVATGHWYIESKHVDSMIQKAQLEKSEHHFQEDVEALGQLVSFAHFSELALELHGRVIVFYCVSHIMPMCTLSHTQNAAEKLTRSFCHPGGLLSY